MCVVCSCKAVSNGDRYAHTMCTYTIMRLTPTPNQIEFIPGETFPRPSIILPPSLFSVSPPLSLSTILISGEFQSTFLWNVSNWNSFRVPFLLLITWMHWVFGNQVLLFRFVLGLNLLYNCMLFWQVHLLYGENNFGITYFRIGSCAYYYAYNAKQVKFRCTFHGIDTLLRIRIYFSWISIYFYA